jgi:hypothetical protein
MSVLFMRELSLRPKDKYGPRPEGIRAQTRGHGDFEIRNAKFGKGGRGIGDFEFGIEKGLRWVG